MSFLRISPCMDSADMAGARREELDIPWEVASSSAHSAVEAARLGYFVTEEGDNIDWSEIVQKARGSKLSLRPESPLPIAPSHRFSETRVQVTNETTLGASKRFIDDGLQPMALNFANGVNPGGGFLSGARAQEEALCRSSALYETLVDDPMYAEHKEGYEAEASDWAILSRDVPVFRSDSGTTLGQPWTLSFLTCAAPYAKEIGQPIAGDLLQRRITRILEIARAYGYSALVLGAWGCGAFGNDPWRTAKDFRSALEDEYSGDFSDVVFAITDWSLERRFLGPFRDVFT